MWKKLLNLFTPEPRTKDEILADFIDAFVGDDLKDIVSTSTPIQINGCEQRLWVVLGLGEGATSLERFTEERRQAEIEARKVKPHVTDYL